MASSAFTETVVEEAALAWFASAGWQVSNGTEIAPGEPAAERDDYNQVVLAQRLRDALVRLNPALTVEDLNDAFRKLTSPGGADLIVRNRALHRQLVDGVAIEYRDADGSIRGAQARVIDFANKTTNDWLALNQFSVVEHKHSRRPHELEDGESLKSWLGRLPELGILGTSGRTQGMRYYVDPALLRASGLEGKTTLVRIEPHRLEALVLEDLARYPGASSSEVNRRIAPEIGIRAVRGAIERLESKGQVRHVGERRWRRYWTVKTN